MRTITVRVPAQVDAQLAAESRKRKISKSDVIRERLQAGPGRRRPSTFDGIADLVGSIDRLPADVSARKKEYLNGTGYGRKRPR